MDVHQIQDFVSWEPVLERETTLIPFLPKPEDLRDQLIYCEICGYRSLYEEDLQNHKKTHEYNCKRCDKTFKRKMHLKVHMLQHTGEKPYECKQCDRKFTHELYLRRHNQWHNLKTISEESSSNTVTQDKVSNIDLIFDYVINKEYPSGMSRNNKSNLRSLSKHYFAQSGKLYYRHRAKKVEDSGNEYSVLLVVRDRDEQRRIIHNIHMGTEDDKPDRYLKNHLGIESTRAKVLEKFYWKNVSRDVREFILACDSCDRLKKPVHNPVYKIDIGECKSRTDSQDKADNIDVDEQNFSAASEDEANNIDIEHNSSTMQQDKAENIDLIFNYVINKKYAPGISKNQKGNIRLLSRHYLERDGQLIYRHRAKKVGNSGNEYREVLVIRDRNEQRNIIESMHINSGDHLGMEKTRAKILEKFYWKNVSKNVRDFVLACDRCQKAYPVRKINMDMIFEYIVNNRFVSGMSKNDKGNLRKVSKHYVAQAGNLYYRQKAERDGDSGNEYREVLVIRDQDEQRRIIKSIHMGSKNNAPSPPSHSLISIMKSIHTGSRDSNTAHCLGSHLGIEKTRAKILEKYYWKCVGKDVKEFISDCDQCKKLMPARKSNVPISEPCKLMTQIWG